MLRYVSVGIGGAVIAGGTFIFWNISHSSRVSNRDGKTSPSVILDTFYAGQNYDIILAWTRSKS